MTTPPSSLHSLKSLSSLLPPPLSSLFTLSYPILPTSSPNYPSPHPHFQFVRTPSTASAYATPIWSSEGAYGKGLRDMLFVLAWAVGLTIGRELLMRGVFGPFVRRWIESSLEGSAMERLEVRSNEKMGNGISNGNGCLIDSTKNEKNGNAKKMNGNANGNGMVMKKSEYRISKAEQRRLEKTVTRFAEQGWTATYAAVSWSFGMYVLYLSTSNPFSSSYLWAGYPHTPLPGLIKFYYLVQAGFWFHQIVIINIEARRKDFSQMLTHHLITTSLVVSSYCTNFTRVGTVVLVLMDFCDIVLPLAKMFRYLSLQRLTDTAFAFFLISWLVTRHLLFGVVLYSVIYKLHYVLPSEWSPSEGKFVTETSIWVFKILLGAIQGMSCIWFYMACKVAYRVVRGHGAEDTRSDDEDTDGEIRNHDLDDQYDDLDPKMTTITTDNTSEPNGIIPSKGIQDDSVSVRKRR